MGNSIIKYFGIALVASIVSVVVSVASVYALDRMKSSSIPNSFTAGTPISAAKVNQNFQALADDINDISFSAGSANTESINPMEVGDVTDLCPTGYDLPVFCECSAANGGVNLISVEAMSFGMAGAGCRCTYHNTEGSNQTIYALAHCMKLP